MAIAVTPNLTDMRYLRKGNCKRCGFCCLGGGKNKPCTDLGWSGEMAICKIYGDHPSACKSFPDAPPILTDKCGYYFIDQWSNKRLKAREV